MDIHYLIEQAKEMMLTRGDVMPMMYLELSEGIHVWALDILSDKQSIPTQCGILARLGWEECKKRPGQKPISVGFYCEAWKSVELKTTDFKLRPVHDPKKQEVISVSFWQADKEPHKQYYDLPVIRDKKKRVVDVGPAEGPKNALSIQLTSFLQGVRDSQHPDEEVDAQLKKAIARTLATLPPEKKQEARDFMRQEGYDPAMIDDILQNL
jgi:hypothetical protein